VDSAPANAMAHEMFFKRILVDFIGSDFLRFKESRRTQMLISLNMKGIWHREDQTHSRVEQYLGSSDEA
jgi:hypothetical protein